MNHKHLTDAELAEHDREADHAWRAMGGDVWSAMKQRCYNPKNKKYRLYGALGVTVCDLWRNSFKNFITYMGPRPGPGYSIDRYPNKAGNYEPGNCRWATDVEQNTNRSINNELSFAGKTQCISAWARETGINYTTIHERLRRGWSVKRALLTPTQPLLEGPGA